MVRVQHLLAIAPTQSGMLVYRRNRENPSEERTGDTDGSWISGNHLWSLCHAGAWAELAALGGQSESRWTSEASARHIGHVLLACGQEMGYGLLIRAVQR